MSDLQSVKREMARSFGSVATAYDSARPDYPPEAAHWLTGGDGTRSVLELGAGTGRLTQHLRGHRLLATDPDVAMLARLRVHLPDVPAVVAAAEQIPVPTHTHDVVVSAQAFHWFDHDVALPEIARVLRPGGELALVWNIPDEGTPWVRKLQRIVPRPGTHEQDIVPLRETAYFGFIEEQRFRTWKNVDKQSLLELVKSRSPYAVADEDTRAAMLADVAALYDDYDRGTAGMQLPFITHCYRARVNHEALAERPTAVAAPTSGTRTTNASPPATPPDPPVDPPDDDGTLLIDFR